MPKEAKLTTKKTVLIVEDSEDFSNLLKFVIEDDGFEAVQFPVTGDDIVAWAKKMEKLGAGEFMLTSMDKDGTKDGYDIELTRTISETVSIPVIASGGAGNLEHLYSGLVDGKADAVLAASIFHFREFTVKEAKEYLNSRGVSVRL